MGFSPFFRHNTENRRIKIRSESVDIRPFGLVLHRYNGKKSEKLSTFCPFFWRFDKILSFIYKIIYKSVHNRKKSVEIKFYPEKTLTKKSETLIILNVR